MKEYKTSDGQSVYDLALMLYGDVSATVKIMQDNPSTVVNVNVVLPSGATVLYDEEQTMNKKITDFVKIKVLKFKTVPILEFDEDKGEFTNEFTNEFNIQNGG